MKDYLQKHMKENLITNEGVERASVDVDEVKFELSEEISSLKKENRIKRNVNHDIKNFDDVIVRKNKFILENKLEENTNK